MPDATDQPTREVITKAAAVANGLQRYFTGVACNRGHIAERSVHNGQCLECLRIHSRDHRARNREVLKRHREASNGNKGA